VLHVAPFAVFLVVIGAMTLVRGLMALWRRTAGPAKFADPPRRGNLACSELLELE
jgi:hypothetical protein